MVTLPSILKNELYRLEEHLKEINAPVFKHLLPEKTEEEICQFFQKHFPELETPKAVQDIYSWHEGTETTFDIPAGELCMFDDMFLCSFALLDTLYTLDPKKDPFKFKENKLLPLFSNGGGEYLVIRLTAADTINTIPEVYYAATWNPGRELFTSIYDSLLLMFKTVNICFEKGVYFIDNEGLLDMNWDDFYRISGEINRYSEYWKGQ